MSTIKVVWFASEQLRTEELTQTGEQSKERRSFELDLAALTEQQRQPIVEFAGAKLSPLDLRQRVIFDESRSHYYLETLNNYFHAQPTLDQILAHIKAEQKAQATAKAHKAQVDAEEKAERERKTALYNKLLPQLERLIEAGDYDGINSFKTGGLGKWAPARKDSLGTLKTEALAEIRANRAAAEKWQWIKHHGSDHLRQSLDRGYDCQRLYAIERAAIEADGFTVDFNDSAAWKDRSCPSEAAIQAEIKAEALGLTASPPKIVWLTAAATHDVPDPYYYYEPEPFEAREAVVIRRYLDKYDLVQTIE